MASAPARWSIASLGLSAIFTVGAAIAGTDAVLGIVSWISPLLNVAECAIVLPWLYAVFRDDAHQGDHTGLARVRALLLRGLLAVVVLLCCAAKWWVLLEADTGTTSVQYTASYRIYTTVSVIAAAFGLLGRGRRFARFLSTVADHPARLLALTFGVSALLGAFLLTMPQSLRRIEDASFVDALFTATSAACITGLTLHDVAETYTFFGQVVILVLFQLGGIGIMVLSAFFAVIAGRRMRVRSSAILAEMIDTESIAAVRKMVVAIVVFTFVIEAIGAAALYASFSQYPEVALPHHHGDPAAGAGSLAWAAIFHSVSAFCSAGFTLFDRSLAPFVGDVPVNCVVISLVVLGGVGFPVINELLGNVWSRLRRRRPPRLSLHSRVVLWVNGALIVGLTVAYAVLEWNGAFAHLDWPTRAMAALFQSVSTRSSGLTTVDVGTMAPATLALTCVWMWIGAAPGSTGGGIKVTTFAVLVATLVAEVRAKPQAVLFDRAIPLAVQRRAIGVTILGSSLLLVGVFLLLLTEPHQPLSVVFEVVSAFGTVGLSTGITPELTPTGRLLLTLAMFVGRIGPITLALAVANRMREVAIERPEERMMIG